MDKFRQAEVIAWVKESLGTTSPGSRERVRRHVSRSTSQPAKQTVTPTPEKRASSEPKPKPAAPKSNTPHLDAYNALKAPGKRSTYLRDNKDAMIAEARQADQAAKAKAQKELDAKLEAASPVTMKLLAITDEYEKRKFRSENIDELSQEATKRERIKNAHNTK